jgi:hypothetical protein
MAEGEERYWLRTRIACELRRLIDSATAVSTEFTIAIKRRAYIVDRSAIHSLRLTAIEHNRQD